MDQAENIMGMLADSLSGFVGDAVVARIIVAVLILVTTGLIEHAITRFLRHLMTQSNQLPDSSIFVNIARLIIWIIGISIVLDGCFGVNVTALVAALGVGGIALSLGLQDTLANFIGGVQVSFLKIVSPGDHIEVGSKKGVVEDITWRQTTIRDAAGDIVIVPNSVISKNAVSKLAPPRCISVPFVATSHQPLDEVSVHIMDAVKSAVKEIDQLVVEPKVVFTEATEEGFAGKVTFEIAHDGNASRAVDAALRSMAPFVHDDQA